MNTQEGTCTKDECLDEIKGYGWLMTAMNLKDNEVAELVTEYINTHKWLIQEKIPFKVSLDQAVHSYYELVYRPLVNAMKSTCLWDVYPADMNMMVVYRSISDAFWTINSQMEDKGVYVTYEEICRERLMGMKGFWLTKIRSILFR
jgi:hypothetical protein